MSLGRLKTDLYTVFFFVHVFRLSTYGRCFLCRLDSKLFFHFYYSKQHYYSAYYKNLAILTGFIMKAISQPVVGHTVFQYLFLLVLTGL